MSNNPNNYPGATASIVGWVSGPAKPPAYDKEGTRGVLEINIPVNEGYRKDGEFVQTGTTWYRYSAAGDFAQNVLAKLGKGDKVRIDNAKQEVREYESGGEKKLGITLTYGEFQVLESAGGSAAAEEDLPF